MISLGALTVTQGQQLSPNALCSQGNSPTGSGMRCQAGGQNTVICWLGLGYLGILDVCGTGASAKSVCSVGNNVG